MKSQLFFIGRLFVFWIIFFTFQRSLFFFHFFPDFSGAYSELISLPFQGFKLDLSAFGYLTSVPFLLSAMTVFSINERFTHIINRIILFYFWLILIVVSIIMASEIVTYIEWKTKLSSKIFIHFGTPSEIFRTSSGSYTLWFFFYFILQLIGGYLLYIKVLKKNVIHSRQEVLLKRVAWGTVHLVGLSFAFVLMIRGGLQQIPVTATDAYFSDKQIVNDLSVNPEWNFIHTCYVYFSVDLSSYYHNLDTAEAQQLMEALYEQSEGVQMQVVEQERPNIILVTLEGWSGQMIAPLGGEDQITPNFNALCEEGVLFTEIYATGGTSETGHSSIISGYPTIAGLSISTESAKCRQLPALNQVFEAEGYNSFYTFGGSLSYGNIGGYLKDVGFDRIVDENDLDLQPSGKLGIHDEAMFPYFLSEIEKAKRPYFYGLFTQSTHSPYDMEADPLPGYEDDPYVTSMHYADNHLGRFVEGVRNLPDFENTLVIFVADHGRAHSLNQNTYDEKYFHIPLLFWGGAIDSTYRGAKINGVGSQADVAKTLLNQLALNSEAFHWSKDLLNSGTNRWAVCTSTLSYGWKDAHGYTVYQMIENRLIQSAYDNTVETDLALKKCRAVLESMYREYLEL